MISITVNGQSRDFPEGEPGSALLVELGLAGAPLVVEYNGSAMSRQQFEAQHLSDGDTVELVSIVGGG